jgi:hypothetical protein
VSPVFAFPEVSLPEIPSTPPSEVRAGDTVKFTVQSAEYPLDGGWTLTYTVNGPVKVAGSVALSGAVGTVTLSATQTATLTPGTYRWLLRVSSGGEVYTIGEGALTVTPNVAGAVAGALTSKAEQTLALLEAELLARAASDHTEYAVDGRSLKRESIVDLQEWRDRLRAEINRTRRGGTLSTFSAHFVRTGA